MRALSKIGAFVAVLIVWAAYSRLTILFWGHYATVNLFLDWAIAAFLPDKRFIYYALIFTHDLLISVLLVLPVGYLLRKCTEANLWGAVIAAVILIFLWDYHQVFLGEGSTIQYFSSFGAVVGVFTSLAILPFVYYLAGKWGGKGVT